MGKRSPWVLPATCWIVSLVALLVGDTSWSVWWVGGVIMAHRNLTGAAHD